MPMTRPRPQRVLAALLLVSLLPIACSPEGEQAATGGPTSALVVSSMTTPPTTSRTLAEVTSTTKASPSSSVPASTFPPASSELGTCQVMGASTTGWEIVLELTGVMGSGRYLVDYVLRGADGAIFETASREIVLSEEEALSYWDSLDSKTESVTSCDVRRLELNREVCMAGRGCTISA